MVPPIETVTVAAAPALVGSLIVTVGGETKLYPLPAVPTTMLVTVSPVRTAVAVAVAIPEVEYEIAGSSVYPLPPLV